jgi:AcrR family transcriptional regulator
MELQDRRVKRTQQLLAKALIELTLEKGYEAVTIREITERADIGYATFFRHYHTKDNLLYEVMEVVLAELMQLLPSSSGTDHAIVGTLLFCYVQQHEAVIRVLLSSQGGTLLVQQIIEAGSQKILLDNQPLESSEIPMEIAAYHIVSATITLIRWWLEHKMPHPPERMGVIYRELIISPTTMVAFKP